MAAAIPQIDASGPAKHPSKFVCEGKRSIFVGALRDNITQDDLIEYFQGFGRVVRAHKIVDKETGIVHNYGFVDFAEYGVVRSFQRHQALYQGQKSEDRHE